MTRSRPELQPPLTLQYLRVQHLAGCQRLTCSNRRKSCSPSFPPRALPPPTPPNPVCSGPGSPLPPLFPASPLSPLRAFEPSPTKPQAESSLGPSRVGPTGPALLGDPFAEFKVNSGLALPDQVKRQVRGQHQCTSFLHHPLSQSSRLATCAQRASAAVGAES